MPLCEFICGNNVDVIPTLEDNSIDAVICSPPYFNSQKKYQRGTGFHYTSEYPEPLYNIFDCLESIKPKLKDHSPVCINLGFSYAETGVMRPFDIINRIKIKLGYFVIDNIIWSKPNPIPIRNRLTNAYEYVFILCKSPKINYNVKKHTLNVFNSSVQSLKGHSAIMPLKLAEFLVQNFSKENDLVLDPYSGSGTTAIASKKGGRNFIGIDINQDYINLSMKRVQKN